MGLLVIKAGIYFGFILLTNQEILHHVYRQANQSEEVTSTSHFSLTGKSGTHLSSPV